MPHRDFRREDLEEEIARKLTGRVMREGLRILVVKMTCSPEPRPPTRNAIEFG